MAIAAPNITVRSRGSGKSAVAGAAYIAGDELYNEREGKLYNYRRKGGIVYTEILTPANAPAWASDRQLLWNSVEKIEKQHDAQLFREFMLPLPKELTQEQNISLARAYAKSLASEGMVVDLAVHDKGDGNPHAHIFATMRPFKEDGTWDSKWHKEYIRDAQGERIKLPSGSWKSRAVPTTDWNTKERFVEWRERFESFTNYHLEKAGREERISVKSYADQGLDQEPTVHMGYYACALEKRGIQTELGNKNRAIQSRNAERAMLKVQLTQIE